MFNEAGQRLPRNFLSRLETVALAGSRDKQLSEKEGIDSPKVIKWNAAFKLGLIKSDMPKLNAIVINTIKSEMKLRQKVDPDGQFGVVGLHISSYDISRVLKERKPKETLMQAAIRLNLARKHGV